LANVVFTHTAQPVVQRTPIHSQRAASTDYSSNN